MKYFALVLFVLCFGLTLNAQSGQPENLPLMNFEKKFIDFGEMKKGDKKEASFKFKNTGTEAIEIDLVSACECTTTEYPRRPVLPNEEGEISIVFDSTEKEESETVDIDIFLKNIDQESGRPIIEMLQFKFELID